MKRISGKTAGLNLFHLHFHLKKFLQDNYTHTLFLSLSSHYMQIISVIRRRKRIEIIWKYYTSRRLMRRVIRERDPHTLKEKIASR